MLSVQFPSVEVKRPTAGRGNTQHNPIRWRGRVGFHGCYIPRAGVVVTCEKGSIKWDGRCVESGEPPHLFGIEPPRPRLQAVRVVDMSGSNAWAEFASLYRATRAAALDHDRAKTGGLLHHPSPPQPASLPLQASETRAGAEKGKRPNLAAQASENLRRRLISELEQLEDQEALAGWAHRALPLKNQLSAEHAQAVESAFAARLAKLNDAPPASDSNSRDGDRHGRRPDRAGPSPEAVTVIGKPVRERDRDHLSRPAVSPLWPDAVRSAPHQVRRAASDGAQGQRPLHRTHVPTASSGASPGRERARLVAKPRDRSPRRRGNSLGEDAWRRPDCGGLCGRS